MKNTKAMEKFMILFAWVAIVTIDVARSAGVNQRLTVAESILNTLQLKTDLVAEDIKENSNRISDINQTVLELDKCFVDENDSPIKTAGKGRNDGPDDARNDGNSRAVLHAFRQEKSYVREMVRSMSATVKALEDTVNRVEAENQAHMKCMSGWTEYKSFGYKYFHLGAQYDVARQICAYHDAHIIDIQNEEEMDFIVSLVPEGAVFWIGLAYKPSQREWIWDRTGKEASYENWQNGLRPFLYWGLMGTCTSAERKEPLNPWVNKRCGQSLSFVCKTKN